MRKVISCVSIDKHWDYDEGNVSGDGVGSESREMGPRQCVSLGYPAGGGGRRAA